MAEQYYEGIGRRKRSTARVRITSGQGDFIVNGKKVDEYFPRFVSRLQHFGIIATIGSAMILLTLIISWNWKARLSLGVGLFIAQHFLLKIPYDHDSWTHYPMQLFIDAGDYNKYPIIPWFGLITGFLEKGEHPETGVIREVEEELDEGLDEIEREVRKDLAPLKRKPTRRP